MLHGPIGVNGWVASKLDGTTPDPESATAPPASVPRWASIKDSCPHAPSPISSPPLPSSPPDAQHALASTIRTTTGMDHLYTTQFAQAISTPAMPSSHQLSTPPPTIDPASTTIKMEDLQAAFDTPAPPPSNASSAGSPAPEGRQAKKRKSWGQVLPEPKTNLPPRKRAKTEDEKEQRRIERVKRNRLAAHNSRERKRQEYETLQAEKDKLEHDLKTARLAMARMTAELNVYRQKYPGEVPESTFEHLTPVSEYDSFLSATSDTVNPAQTTSTSFPSPVSMTMDSMDSPRDSSCQPETPDFSETAADFDQTRYPAEILCDLQCQSKALAVCRSPQPLRPQLPAIWAFLTLFNLTLPLTRSLLTLFSTSTSSPTPQTTTQLWTALLAWLTQTSSSAAPSSAKPTSSTLMAFLTPLMQSTSTCRQPLAQLWLATRLSQRSSISNRSVGRSLRVAARRSRLDGAARRRLRSSLRSRQITGRRQGFALRKEILSSLESGGLHDGDLRTGRQKES